MYYLCLNVFFFCLFLCQLNVFFFKWAKCLNYIRPHVLQTSNHTHNTWQTVTVISVCLDRPSAADQKKKRVAPQWKMLTLFLWLPECWLAGGWVLIIQKKKKKQQLPITWWSPVIPSVVAGSGLSGFFSWLGGAFGTDGCRDSPSDPVPWVVRWEPRGLEKSTLCGAPL